MCAILLAPRDRVSRLLRQHPAKPGVREDLAAAWPGFASVSGRLRSLLRQLPPIPRPWVAPLSLLLWDITVQSISPDSNSCCRGWKRAKGRRTNHRREKVRRMPRTPRAQRQPLTLRSHARALEKPGTRYSNSSVSYRSDHTHRPPGHGTTERCQARGDCFVWLGRQVLADGFCDPIRKG